MKSNACKCGSFFSLIGSVLPRWVSKSKLWYFVKQMPSQNLRINNRTFDEKVIKRIKKKSTLQERKKTLIWQTLIPNLQGYCVQGNLQFTNMQFAKYVCYGVSNRQYWASSGLSCSKNDVPIDSINNII